MPRRVMTPVLGAVSISWVRRCQIASHAPSWTPEVASANRGLNASSSGTTSGAARMGILSEIFSWWGGNTWGTRLTIWHQGRFVGRDEFGNRYYIQKKGVGPLG